MRYGLIIGLLALWLPSSLAFARTANPYPVAALRQGDVYLVKGKGDWQRRTFSGDVQALCWISRDTLCFERQLQTKLPDTLGWQGIDTISDLFLVSRDGKSTAQFTTDHFAQEPSTGTIRGRAIFAHRPQWLTDEYEIWETIRPNIRNRPLGIRGHEPDASADQHWIAVTLNGEKPAGVGLFGYPSAESHRKIEGEYYRPRFSPNSQLLAFLRVSPEADSSGIYAVEVPDGEIHFLLKRPQGFAAIKDFGWSDNGAGLTLVLEDSQGRRDLYFYDLQIKALQRLSDQGNIERATSWH